MIPSSDQTILERDEPSTKKSSTWGRCFFWLLLITIICGASLYTYGTFGAKILKKEYIRLSEKDLPQAAGLRIAFFADVHDSDEMLELARREIARAKPDIILFGGDIITSGKRNSRPRKLIQELQTIANIAPTYAILGNHDVEQLPTVERMLKRANITLLRNESTSITCPDGGKINLVGLSDWNLYDEDPDKCLQKKGASNESVLLLSHDPESRHLLKDYDWNLMLCGHTHGGQLGNPYTGEYISLRSAMAAGLYDSYDSRKVYVTRGLGATYGIRFFCPAELTIIDIESDEEREKREARTTSIQNKKDARQAAKEQQEKEENHPSLIK